MPLWLVMLPWKAQARLCSALTMCLWLRSAWADYFDAAGIDFVFWSAKTAIDGLAGPVQSVAGHVERDERARVVSIDQLLAIFEAQAQAGVDARLGKDGAADTAVQVCQENSRGCMQRSAGWGHLLLCLSSLVGEAWAGQGRQPRCPGAQAAGALQLPGCAVKTCWELLHWEVQRIPLLCYPWEGQPVNWTMGGHLCNSVERVPPGLFSKDLLGTGAPQGASSQAHCDAAGGSGLQHGGLQVWRRQLPPWMGPPPVSRTWTLRMDDIRRPLTSLPCRARQARGA